MKSKPLPSLAYRARWTSRQPFGVLVEDEDVVADELDRTEEALEERREKKEVWLEEGILF